jgi:hypothetical protein
MHRAGYSRTNDSPAHPFDPIATLQVLLLFLGNCMSAHRLRPLVTTGSTELCLPVVPWPTTEDKTRRAHRHGGNISLVVSSPHDARAAGVNPCLPIRPSRPLRQSIMKSTGLQRQGALGDRGWGGLGMRTTTGKTMLVDGNGCLHVA